MRDHEELLLLFLTIMKYSYVMTNVQVMEKIKEMGRPFTFPVFKVSKSSLEFIRYSNVILIPRFLHPQQAIHLFLTHGFSLFRFECEIDNYGSMENVLAKLDMKTVKPAS